MATALRVRSNIAGQAVATRADLLRGGLRFDWLVTLAAAVFGVGVVVDARGHLLGSVDSSILSARHAPLYGGVLLIGLLLATSLGKYGYRGLPAGYALSFVGVMAFFVAGGADLAWHAAFGVETGLATILSPTHVWLAVAGGLVVTGPLRAAQHRLARERAPNWSALAPALIAAAYVLGLLAILTAYAHPLVGTYAMQAPPSATRPASLSQPLGVASVLLQSAVLMGVVLILVRTWRLPVGGIALLVLASSLPVIVLSGDYGFLPGVLASAGLSEVLYRLLQPSPERPLRFHGFAFGVPAIFYSVYFASLALGVGIGWSSHLMAASVVAAGVAGLLVSCVALPAPCSAPGGEQT